MVSIDLHNVHVILEFVEKWDESIENPSIRSMQICLKPYGFTIYR